MALHEIRLRLTVLQEVNQLQPDPQDIRREYGQTTLARADLRDDPLAQFTDWFDSANTAGLLDATAMTLATADTAGRPSARIVLLKYYDQNGFVWFSDYRSQKGVELAENPQASVMFYWRELERQVRITGSVSRTSRELSAEYFSRRPDDSRFSAAASRQSSPIENREVLQAAVARLQARYPDGDMPTPETWGGFRLVPDEYEFWQGRTGRLHDRFRYLLNGQDWEITRLQP